MGRDGTPFGLFRKIIVVDQLSDNTNSHAQPLRGRRAYATAVAATVEAQHIGGDQFALGLRERRGELTPSVVVRVASRRNVTRRIFVVSLSFFSSFVDWLLANIDKRISPANMAARLSMSVRNFNRTFLRETGTAPLAFVERARVEAARRRLEEGRVPGKTIAAQTGFGTYEAMRKAFRKILGLTPQAYRERFGHGHHRTVDRVEQRP